jgi:hypothetical protein
MDIKAKLAASFAAIFGTKPKPAPEIADVVGPEDDTTPPHLYPLPLPAGRTRLVRCRRRLG